MYWLSYTEVHIITRIRQLKYNEQEILWKLKKTMTSFDLLIEL